MISQSLTDAARTFQYDYIYIDAILLTIWLLVVIKYKKWRALKAGILFGIVVYFIDAVFWWNISAGPNYPIGIYIREYWIGGIQMPHPLGQYFFLKFGADFMMTLSYSLYAFTWLWIMFENIEERDKKEILVFTALFIGFWMITPLISQALAIDNTIVHTVRHMDTQIFAWISNVIIGYSILIILYGTDLFKSKNPKIIGIVFVIGCIESFFMEFPLFITGIRPANVPFLIYEIFFLFNQGAPYLFILWDKVLPKLKERFFS